MIQTLLLAVNTAILLILFGDKLRTWFKERVLDKTQLDEKLTAAIKDLIDKIKKD